MFEMKKISPDAVAAALERVERYRLLNEPRVAESICLDILTVDPGNDQANIGLILALTDQFSMEGTGNRLNRRALDLAAELADEYQRFYYTGIIYEREGKARLSRGYPGASFDAYDLLHQAMRHFDQAEPLEPTGVDDSVLRWNSCARIITDYDLQERPVNDEVSLLE
jgi:hypothetical protein